MKIKECKIEISPRTLMKSLVVDKRLETDRVKPGFDEETAVKEARRCLYAIRCESCDLCRLFCPDLCITRDEQTGEIKIDNDFCKGCGICAFICPRGAITMVLEE